MVPPTYSPLLVHGGQVVEHRPQFDMLRPMRLLHQRERELVGRFGGRLRPLLAIELRQVVQADRDVGMRRAQRLAFNRQHPLVQRFRRGPIALAWAISARLFNAAATSSCSEPNHASQMPSARA